MKKLLSILSISVVLFATDYTTLEKNRADISQYENLKFKQSDISQYKNLMYKGTKTDFSNLVQNSDFLTKNEIKEVKNKVQKYSKYLNKKRDFILYFTSESVPTNTMLNTLFQVGILQENGFDILTKQYFLGMNKDFKDYLFKMQDKINNKPKFERLKIIRNSGIKIDPRYFDFFKLKKVPAIALAECTGTTPSFKSCEFKFLLRGDTSLESFFDKIKTYDAKYEKYYEVLLANKFDKKEVLDNEKK